MRLGRPPFIKFFLAVSITNRRQIIYQGIKPNINYLGLVAGHRNSPAPVRPRNADIGHVVADIIDGFVAPRGWLYKIWMIVYVFKEALAIFCQSEKIIFLS